MGALPPDSPSRIPLVRACPSPKKISPGSAPVFYLLHAYVFPDDIGNPIGSPLGSTFAEIFFNHFQNKIIFSLG